MNAKLTLKHGRNDREIKVTSIVKSLSGIISEKDYEKAKDSYEDYLLKKYTLLERLIVPKPELNEDLPISAINAASTSFQFLEDEHEIY